MSETIKLRCGECLRLFTCNTQRNPDGACPNCGSCDYDLASPRMVEHHNLSDDFEPLIRQYEELEAGGYTANAEA